MLKRAFPSCFEETSDTIEVNESLDVFLLQFKDSGEKI